MSSPAPAASQSVPAVAVALGEVVLDDRERHVRVRIQSDI